MTALREFFDEQNLDLSGGIHLQGENLRYEFLERAGKVLRRLLLEDVDNLEDTPVGQPVNKWVHRDEGLSPMAELDGGPTCLSFRFVGENPYEQRVEQLRVLVPIPDGFDEFDRDAITGLEDPEEVYTERVELDAEGRRVKVLGRYMINRALGTAPYQLTPDEGRPIDANALHFILIQRRVSPELSRLSRILEDMGNADMRAQLQFVKGEDTNHEL